MSQCYKFSDLVGGVSKSIQALGGWGKRYVLKLPQLQKLTQGNSFNLAQRVVARVHLCFEFYIALK